MFNLFPKFGSFGDSVGTESLYTSIKKEDNDLASGVVNEVYEIIALKNELQHQLDENAKLKKDFEDQKQLKDSLQRVNEKYIKKITEQEDKIILLENAIERWHSRSKEWEKMDEEIQSSVSELTKEVIDLRHLKTENVELIERLLQKEGNNYGITFNEAKTKIIQNDYKKCAEERDELKAEVEKLKNESQKHPMYPLHWGGYDKNIIDFVESEFNNEDPLEGKQVEFNAEELLKRVTEYADSLDTLPKSFPDEFQEKSWEEVASDLALRVVKLEKKVEELTIIRYTSDPNYNYFKNHGTWPWHLDEAKSLNEKLYD